MTELPIFAAFAEELADVARGVAARWRARDLGTQDKGQSGIYDPVTEADREIERALRDRIDARWPDHGIEGEEFGTKPAAGPYCWSLDPIDGTRSFVCGLPTWTVLIALLHEGRPVLGVIDAPRLEERFVGYGYVAEHVTAAGRMPLRTSRCRSLRDARLATTDPYLFAPEERESFERVRRGSRMARYGQDAYAYARLSAGGLDLVVESGLAPHDLNALVPLVRASGGAVSDWQGGVDFSPGRLVAAASPDLLEAALSQLAFRPATS